MENQARFGFPAAVVHGVLAVLWPVCWRELTVCWRPGAGRMRAIRMHATVVSYSGFVGWRGSGVESPVGWQRQRAEGDTQNRGKGSNFVAVKGTFNKVAAVETQLVTEIVIQWMGDRNLEWARRGLLADSVLSEVCGGCAAPLSHSAAEGRWEL